MIAVDNISKTFKLYRKPSDRLKEIFLRHCFHKSFHAVSDVSFQVDDGQTLGIVGENGAGKSTVLKLLTGVLIPDVGHVALTGKITGLLELGTGFNPEFSGIDNIIHNATYLGLSRAEINTKLDRIIAFTELGDFIHEPIKTYSSGMVMRLAFSVAIHAEPTAFVVDEALSVGDAYFQQKCMTKIREFKKDGGSIVFVSHDMNAVKVLCDKAILLDKGKVSCSADPDTVINAYNFLIARRSRSRDVAFATDLALAGYGNRKVTIDDISLTDDTGNSAEIFVTGRPAGINLRLRCHRSMKALTVGIVIRDRFGQDIYGTNSCYLDQPLSMAPDDTLDLVYWFDALNLGPGKYSVTAAVHTGQSHVDECAHWVDGGVVFEVVTGEDHFFTGLARLTPCLQIRNQTAATAALAAERSGSSTHSAIKMGPEK